MKKMASAATNCVDPIPESEYPSLQPYTGSKPTLPQYWKCTAVLHPFSPLQSNSTPADRESPFFEVCTASVSYAEGEGLNALLVGKSGRKWWYKVTPTQTTVSTDGVHYAPIDLGWSLPSTDWFGDKTGEAKCSGTSYLNWMKAQEVDWWKIPVGNDNPPPATWMWFDHSTQLPMRLMFGQGPIVSPTMGDKTQLALFQMFSFTYFPSFEALNSNPLNTPLADPTIQGFSFGNPNNYQLFEWNTNFGMTVFMTPVNEKFNPLPTRVLYRWASDNEYHVSNDRSQNTLMKYTYNQGNPFTSQVALLTGPAPQGMTPPPNSGAGFLINYNGDQITKCIGFGNFPFPQEPPNWAQIPQVDGTIHATVEDNPVLGPGNTVTIISVLFPPSGNNYPDSTYLWTWYSPLNSSGSSSRPITFMQSQAGVNVGTSLALADYFYYEELATPIPPCNFDVPPCDFNIKANVKWQKTGIRINQSTVAHITYESGLWTANPEDNGGQLYNAAGNPRFIEAKPGYTMPGQNEGALIGRIGDHVFLVGMGTTTPAGLSGELDLCINDDLNGIYGAGFTDNEGSINVQISVGF